MRDKILKIIGSLGEISLKTNDDKLIIGYFEGNANLSFLADDGEIEIKNAKVIDLSKEDIEEKNIPQCESVILKLSDIKEVFPPKNVGL